MKYIYKFICICLLVATILLFKNSGVVMESKSTNSNLNKNLNLNAMAKVIENFNLNDIYSVLDTYSGDLTGYAADCPLCSGKLGCNGQNVLDRTTEYYDAVYGNVRIVASSRSLPCGSIVRFTSPFNSSEKMTAIVLDRGVTGTALDLLVESEDFARKNIGRRNISYEILRFGWTKARA